MRAELTALLRKVASTTVDLVVRYGFQVVGALIILFVGWRLSWWVSRLFVRVCEKKKLDVTITKFAAGALRGVILAFTVIVALEKFGVTVAPFVAAIGALAFGGSFAIQGPLSNYGAGLSIILGKPFSVGDTITVVGESGVVEEIKLARTILINADGVRIVIPNKHIVGEVIHNSAANRVAEGVVGISYGDDPEKAMEAIRRVLRGFPEIASEPKVRVGIKEFGDSSVNIALRYWIPTRQYYETLYAVNLAVFKALKEAGITIPFPQREVRLLSDSNGAAISGALAGKGRQG